MASQISNIKLVKEIQKYPCLYDTTKPEFSRRDKVEQAWNAVGNVVNLSGRECRDRWRNLRVVFIRHMRRSDKQKKPYYLANAMAFARPFMRLNPKVPVITNVQGGEESEEITVFPKTDPLASPGVSPRSCSLPPLSPSSFQAQSYPYLPPSTPSTSSQSPLNTLISLESKDEVKRERDSDFYDNDMELPQEINGLHQEANKMFLLSLLPDLNLMNPRQVRRFKKQVMETIENIIESKERC